MNRAVALLLCASCAASAANAPAYDVKGIRLGMSEAEVRSLYPDVSCVAYKWRLDADRVCTARKSTFATATAIYVTLNLIADRVTQINAELEYDGFDALIAQLERDLGAPLYRYITDTPGRLEHVDWRSESESIRLWTAHNCARPIGCRISLRWADENTKTLLEERRAYFMSQRPVVSNLSPTEAQFAAGAVLLEQLKRVYELEAVVPRELRSKLSTVVESNVEANGPGVRPYRVVSSLPNIVVKDTRYTLGSADAPRGGSLSIRIDDHAACVTEELLRKAWGKETNRFSPIHHHGSANYLPPQGLRSPSVNLTYSTPQLINVTFHFVFVHCTQSISIDDRMPRIK